MRIISVAVESELALLAAGRLNIQITGHTGCRDHVSGSGKDDIRGCKKSN